jgi:hypothetical protein
MILRLKNKKIVKGKKNIDVKEAKGVNEVNVVNAVNMANEATEVINEAMGVRK